MGMVGTCDACGRQIVFFAQGKPIHVNDWTHLTGARPSFLQYVLLGSSAVEWFDFCPACMAGGVPAKDAPVDHVMYGPVPTGWKVARWAFLLASIVGSIAVYERMKG